MKNNEKEYSLKRERVNFGALSGAAVCLFIAVIVLLNVVVTSLGNKVTLKLDLTENQILDFSEITEKTVKNLKEDVNVYSLIPESSGYEIANCLAEILAKYNRLSKHIKYEVVDANKNPGFMSKYAGNTSQISTFSVVFEQGDRFKIVDLADSVSYMSGNGSYIDLANAEKKFTSAILYVTSDDETRIAVLDGTHGEYMSSPEYPAYDVYSSVFGDENYVLEKVDIVTSDIPEDTDIVFLATPGTDYTEEEIAKLDNFLKSGKALQLCFDQNSGDLPNLKAYFKDEWGITFEDGVLLEGDSNQYSQGLPYAVIPTYESSEITDSLVSFGLIDISSVSPVKYATVF